MGSFCYFSKFVPHAFPKKRSLYNGEYCFSRVYFLTWDGSLEEEEKRALSGFGLFMLTHSYLTLLSWAKELSENSVNTVCVGKKEGGT